MTTTPEQIAELIATNTALTQYFQNARAAMEQQLATIKIETATAVQAAIEAMQQQQTIIGTQISEQLSQATTLNGFAGIIVMWSGTLNAIPDGWLLCDGENDTPDLRGCFIVGAHPAPEAGDDASEGVDETGKPYYAIGETGGDAWVTPDGSVIVNDHTLSNSQMGPHEHLIPAFNGSGSSMTRNNNYGRTDSRIQGWGSSTDSQGGGEPHAHPATLTLNDQDNRPPFYALAFIMMQA